MAKTKRATATVKMTYQDDVDLIAWWNSIPRGTRNAVMKDMMRDYIERNRGGYRPLLPKNVPQPFDPLRFTQMCDDTAWIRNALLELPGYVEQVIQYVATNAQAVPIPAGGAPPTQGANEADAARREARMRQAHW